ncbi:hypothetical protein MTP99_016271 [Tenebrio molitor]|nr:hypothetical protein MTP99_016271 [Tenebrio molitor]
MSISRSYPACCATWTSRSDDGRSLRIWSGSGVPGKKCFFVLLIVPIIIEEGEKFVGGPDRCFYLAKRVCVSMKNPPSFLINPGGGAVYWFEAIVGVNGRVAIIKGCI